MLLEFALLRSNTESSPGTRLHVARFVESSYDQAAQNLLGCWARGVERIHGMATALHGLTAALAGAVCFDAVVACATEDIDHGAGASLDMRKALVALLLEKGLMRRTLDAAAASGSRDPTLLVQVTDETRPLLAYLALVL